MNRGVQVALVIALSSFIAGCATPLTEANRAKIQQVSIDPNISVPESVRYIGPKENMLMSLFPPLADVFSKHGSNAKKLKQAVADNKIDMKSLFLDRFTSQLKGSKIFPDVSSEKNDAVFSFKIEDYGLVTQSGFNKPKPWLSITGLLTASNGEIVWKQREVIGPFTEGTTALTGKEYFDNPALIKSGLECAATIISSNFVNRLRSDK